MSVEVFNIPSDSSFTALDTGAGSNEFSTSSSHLSVQDVRITPSHMHFENAFEGKSYKQKLVIQNCGRRLVYVRLFPCNSTMFQYKPFEQGVCLSPGMKITRMVKYIYLSIMGTLRGMASIWINDEEVIYKFYVTLSTAVLEVVPQVLDFGKMDAVNHTSTRTFRIKNDGHRAINFAIDMGRNVLQLNVQPTKGTVHAKSSVVVTAEIVGTEGGDFCEEFWIKTNPAQRIIVKGTFVAPKFLVRKFISSLDFKFVDFPSTYYGSGNIQMVLVENDSPSNSMFCVMAEVKNVTMTVEEAKKVDVSYQCFDVEPMDGRIQANKGSLFYITFKPIKTSPNRNYAACFFKIIRMDCQDVNDTSIYDTKKISSATHLEDTTSLIAYEYSREDITLTSGNESFQDSSRDDQFSFEHSIKVCVHGEKEIAGVDLTPDVIHLSDLTLERKYERTVLVKNKSQKLPIKVKYNKIGCVIVTPAEFELQPGGTLEVLLVIHTIRFGEIRKKITFDLVSSFKTVGDNIVRKVGDAKLEIHLEVLNIVKKTRLDQCILCKDLLEKLTPEFPYRLNDEELAKKVQNDDYYLNYIRSLKKISRNGKFEEYAVTDKKLVKCQNLVIRNIPRISQTEFIPLVPRLLYNIKITPKSIRLRNLTANSSVTRFFEINNMNTFPIRVFAKPSKSNIVFQNNGRCIIQGGKKQKINFTFITTGIGRYYGNISVLINDSTFYEVTTVAQVFSKNLELDVDRLVFYESGPQYKFIKLSNPFTSAAYFTWDLAFGCFEIYPQKGKIRAEGSILCMVTFNSMSPHAQSYECVLKYENGQTKSVRLSYKKEEPFVALETYDIDMSPIPLNVPKKRKIIMRNFKNSKVFFRVVNPTPLLGISIEPISGTLMGLDTQAFVITFHIKAVIEFHIKLIFLIDEVLDLCVTLHGIVEYPDINLSPNGLQFMKIAPYSFDTQVFNIHNKSETEVYITFPRHEFPEFTVTSSEKKHYPHQEKLVLRGNESKLMYVHFQPEYNCTYALFLGYITNDILGPARILLPDGDTTVYFLGENTKLYTKYPDVKVRFMPETLKTISINCTTSKKIIEFSNLMFDFVFFRDNHCDNVTQCDFVITNVSEEVASVCIRTDNLGDSGFTLVPKTDNCEVYNVSYRVDIEPGTKAVFEIGFYPQNTGEYNLELPIFLRRYQNNRIFNYLTLNGVYKTPTIKVSMARLDFEPVPEKVPNKIPLTVEMEHHFEYCQFSLDTGVGFITLILGEQHKAENGITYLDIDVICSCDDTYCFDTNMVLRCSCGSTCSVPITGVNENCLLTTHVYSHFLNSGFPRIENLIEESSTDNLSAHRDKPFWFFLSRSRLLPSLSMNTNTTTYPLFPSIDDHSDYAKYMRSLQKTLENWIYSQGFYKKRYYRIPEGFTDLFKTQEVMHHTLLVKVKKQIPTKLPLLQLVTSFAGGRNTDHLKEPIPNNSDHVGWFSYTCRTYSKILQFLRGFPIFAPHVETKFLLNYDQYVFYEKIKRPKSKPLDEMTFYLRSKQCWIDLILQIIKTFVLFRSVPKERSTLERSEVRYDNLSFTSASDLVDVFESGIYGSREMYLLSWLQKLYNSGKGHLWGNLPKDIDVVYFDENLRNGLVLGAVTAHYCPYVKTKIQEMYGDPQTPEEYHHNACILLQTWDMLYLSYDVKPFHILSGDMLKMLLLVTYLHNVLPNLSPKDKIRIDAKLTQKDSKSIEIQNTGEDPIYYKVIFFHNEDQQFSVINYEVKVDPYEVKTVKIFYYAKRVNPETVTLLFSGETPGHKYGTSIVVTVEGIPDITHVSTELNITTDLYKICKIVLPVQTPFKKRTMYKLFIAFNPVDEKYILYPFDSLITFRKVCETFFENYKTCEFNKDGWWKNTATVCVRQVEARTLWMYFTHPEEGDFGVKVIVTGRPTDECYEDIDVWIPANYKNLVCRCKSKSFDKNCPRVIQIELPKKNKLIWNARKAMVLEQITEEEKIFWSTRLFSQVGTRVLKLIMSTDDHPLHECVDDFVEYDTEIEPATCIDTVLKVTVDDVISDDIFTLPVHPWKNPLYIKNCVLRLKSMTRKESRFYKLHFKHKQGEGDSTINLF